MSWTAYLFQTTTGAIGPKVEVSSMNWEASLNDTETVRVSLKKSSLPKVDLQTWLSPWWGGVILMWKDEPIVAAVNISQPSEFRDTVSLDCRGIRALLDRRLVAREMPNWHDITDTKVSYKDKSLAFIARDVVRVGMEKSAGMLPIGFRPSETAERGVTPVSIGRLEGPAGPRLALPVHVPSRLNQTVHPSVLYFASGWNGYRYWMSHTPYPYGDDSHEDPNIVASNDGTNWVVPKGLTNPLDDQDGEPAYNSDTVITMGPNNDMYLFWRTYDPSAQKQEQIWYRSSSDGVKWTEKQLAYANSQAERRTISPAVVWHENQWHMWYVDMTFAPFKVHYVQSLGASPKTWGVPAQCAVSSLKGTKQPWHISVRRVGNKWVGLLNTTNRVSTEPTGQGELHVIESTTGTSFETQDTESVIPRISRNEHEGLYGASMVRISDNVYDVWYSAMALNPAGVIWGIFRTQLKRVENFEDASGGHDRNYEGFNVANIRVDDILQKLSEVSNGPDIMFRPKLLSSSKFIWEMYTGNELDPRIPQTLTPIWDTTTINSEVTELQMVMSGDHQTHRVYSTGAGQDAGVILEVAEDLSPTARGYPLLETTIATGDSADPNVVMGWGEGALEANSKPLLEITMQVRADGQYGLGRYWPGDVVQLVVEGWINLPDGVNKARLLSISGTEGANLRLSLQPED